MQQAMYENEQTVIIEMKCCRALNLLCFQRSNLHYLVYLTRVDIVTIDLDFVYARLNDGCLFKNSRPYPLPSALADG